MAKEQQAIKDCYGAREFGEKLNKATIALFAARVRVRSVLAEHQDMIEMVSREEPNIIGAVGIIDSALKRISETMEKEKPDGEEEGDEGEDY